MVFKLERFSHLLDRSFGLGSLIGFGFLLLVLLLRVSVAGERGFGVKAIQSVNRPRTSDFFRSVSRDVLRGSPTY